MICCNPSQCTSNITYWFCISSSLGKDVSLVNLVTACSKSYTTLKDYQKERKKFSRNGCMPEEMNVINLPMNMSLPSRLIQGFSLICSRYWHCTGACSPSPGRRGRARSSTTSLEGRQCFCKLSQAPLWSGSCLSVCLQQ